MTEPQIDWRERTAQEIMLARQNRTVMTWCYRWADEQAAKNDGSYEAVFHKIQAGKYAFNFDPHMGRDPLTSDPAVYRLERQADGSYLEKRVTPQQEPVYCTSFCNRGHSLIDGAPIDHRCFKIPVSLLKAEQAETPDYLDKWARWSEKTNRRAHRGRQLKVLNPR